MTAWWRRQIERAALLSEREQLRRRVEVLERALYHARRR